MAYDITKNVTLGQLKEGLVKCKEYTDRVVAALPKEMFLDQTQTTFVKHFTFNSATYPGAENPNLDGKSIFVLAVKGVDNSVTYSFVNLEALMNIYNAANNSIAFEGNSIKVNLSSETNNCIEMKNDGLFVDVPSNENNITKSDIATTAEITEMLSEIFTA